MAKCHLISQLLVVLDLDVLMGLRGLTGDDSITTVHLALLVLSLLGFLGSHACNQDDIWVSLVHQLLDRLLLMGLLLLLHESLHALDVANNVLSVDLGIYLKWLELLKLLSWPFLPILILGVRILPSSHLGVEVETLVPRCGLLTGRVVLQSGWFEGNFLIIFLLLLFQLFL